jgi:hypothetical protein
MVDLTSKSWPVVYSLSSKTIEYLHYATGFYLFPAGLASCLGVNPLVMLGIWTSISVVAALLCLARFLKSHQKASLKNTLLVWGVILATLLMTSEWFSKTRRLSQPMYVMFWIPTQHATAALLLVALTLVCLSSRKLPPRFFAIPAALFYSPFVGVAFGLTSLFDWVFHKLKPFVSTLLWGGVGLAGTVAIAVWFSPFFESVHRASPQLFYSLSHILEHFLLAAVWAILCVILTRREWRPLAAAAFLAWLFAESYAFQTADLIRVGELLPRSLIFLLAAKSLMRSSGLKGRIHQFFITPAFFILTLFFIGIGTSRGIEMYGQLSPTKLRSQSIS